MKYNYLGIMFNVEYVVLSPSEYEIWLQNPDDIDDFHYLEDLPENVQDTLNLMVDVDVSSVSDETSEKEYYL